MNNPLTAKKKKVALLQSIVCGQTPVSSLMQDVWIMFMWKSDTEVTTDYNGEKISIPIGDVQDFIKNKIQPLHPFCNINVINIRLNNSPQNVE